MKFKISGFSLLEVTVSILFFAILAASSLTALRFAGKNFNEKKTNYDYLLLSNLIKERFNQYLFEITNSGLEIPKNGLIYKSDCSSIDEIERMICDLEKQINTSTNKNNLSITLTINGGEGLGSSKNYCYYNNKILINDIVNNLNVLERNFLVQCNVKKS